MNPIRGSKYESDTQWVRGQRSTTQESEGQSSQSSSRAMGSDRKDGFAQSATSDHQQQQHQHEPASYYSPSLQYSYSPSHHPHPTTWSSGDVQRHMSFVPSQSYMSDPLSSAHHSHPDHSQYMDIFAPTSSYAYNSYSGNFFTPHSPLTGAGGDTQFWGQQKHPVHGSNPGYQSDMPFFGNRNDYTGNHAAASVEGLSGIIGAMSLHGQGNGYMFPNGMPSNGSENSSSFSPEQESQHSGPTGFQNRPANSHSHRSDSRRTGNQSWASVASQPVRSGGRGKHYSSQSNRPAAVSSVAETPVAWNGSLTSEPNAASSKARPSEAAFSVPQPDQKRETESQCWVLLNDQPSPPPIRSEIPSDSYPPNVAQHNTTVRKVVSDATEGQRRMPVARGAASCAPVRDQMQQESDRCQRRGVDEVRNPVRRVPPERSASVACATNQLKPVIDPKTVKDKVRLDHIFNPKDFDLNPANARFFVIKSYSEDDIHRSIKYSIWCSTERGNKRLDEAFAQSSSTGGVIYLFFSVNGSGHFCGMAQMLSPLDYNSSANVWAQDKWKGQFKVRWIYVKDVPNAQLRHIRLENNENKPVTNSRDTQEVPPDKGRAVLSILHSFKHSTSIFDDFLHYEKRQEEEIHRRVESKNVQPPHFRSRDGRDGHEAARNDQPRDRQDYGRERRQNDSLHGDRNGGWDRGSVDQHEMDQHHGRNQHSRRDAEASFPRHSLIGRNSHVKQQNQRSN